MNNNYTRVEMREREEWKMKNLTKQDIDLICEYLGERAVKEYERGNSKREKRIFKLIEKLRGAK